MSVDIDHAYKLAQAIECGRIAKEAQRLQAIEQQRLAAEKEELAREARVEFHRIALQKDDFLYIEITKAVSKGLDHVELSGNDDMARAVTRFFPGLRVKTETHDYSEPGEGRFSYAVVKVYWTLG